MSGLVGQRYDQKPPSQGKIADMWMHSKVPKAEIDWRETWLVLEASSLQPSSMERRIGLVEVYWIRNHFRCFALVRVVRKEGSRSSWWQR